MKSLMAVVAAGGLLAGLATAQAAPAVPALQTQSTSQGIVTDVARRGGGRGMSGPRMGGPRMGGPRMSGPRRFSGGPRARGPRAGGGRHAHRPRSGRHHHRHRGHRHHIRPRYGYGYGFYGALPYGVYAFDDSVGECNWLRRRALETGSRYWWHRYEVCLDDY